MENDMKQRLTDNGHAMIAEAVDALTTSELHDSIAAYVIEQLYESAAGCDPGPGDSIHLRFDGALAGLALTFTEGDHLK
jgi:hypothetical protein